MVENDISRRGEEKCKLVSTNLQEYQQCIEQVNYESSLRYLHRNQ